ncbi:hypothetical protein CHF27_009085 [Romboutsia maritimum]|uniref:Cell wall-binding repeat-containing protein n=1 Tax=Romboutsia maritimum TaxID=2020948 RepID=A0A371IS26_9FIRM|nr:cell wall-binding repeat-containing protein [Romboutsia maritimum]RDY23288.1 hypothetical protein CHF27_009085 [Romboutsia maritimum]
MNKKQKKAIAISAVVAIGAGSLPVSTFANETDTVNDVKLAGEDRYETAVNVSEYGWDKSDEVVLVNSSSIADSLSSTALAAQKNAPILLTSNGKLNEKTKKEIKRLSAKKVYIIGGESAISKSIEKELNLLKITIERISGKDRYETSLNIAKKIDEKKAIKKVAIVNGIKGLADGVSIGSIAGMENMPIILSQKDSLGDSEKWINSKSIDNAYVIGQNGVLSDILQNKLPNSKRLGGQDRYDTNAKIIEEFYNNQNLENVFITKGGMNKQDELIDALSAGALAAIKKAPIVLAGNALSDNQKFILLDKQKGNIVQVGGGISQTCVGEAKRIGSKEDKIKMKLDEIEKINDKIKNNNRSEKANSETVDKAIKVIDTGLRNSGIQREIGLQTYEIEKEAREAVKVAPTNMVLSSSLDKLVNTISIGKDGEYRVDRLERALVIASEAQTIIDSMDDGDKKESLTKSIENIKTQIDKLILIINNTEATINKIDLLRQQLEAYKGGLLNTDQMETLLTQISQMAENIPLDKIKEDFEKIMTKVTPMIETLKKAKDTIDGISNKVTEITATLDAINQKVSELKGLLDKYSKGELTKEEALKVMSDINNKINSLPEGTDKANLQKLLKTIQTVISPLMV